MGDQSTELGAYIRERRLAAGMTLRDLAAVIGVSHVYISDIERGRRRTSDRAAKAIGEALGIELLCPCCGRALRERARKRPRKPVGGEG